MTVADFHNLGSTPSLSEQFKMPLEGAKRLSIPMAEY